LFEADNRTESLVLYFFVFPEKAFLSRLLSFWEVSSIS